MTDTTDTAALRDKHELALKDLTERLRECNRLNFCMDELSAFAAFSSTVIDQLEAERQRADGSEFLPKNLERALTIMGMALPESKEEFNFQAERWMQRLIDRVIRFGDEIQSAPVMGTQEPVAYFAAAPDYGWDTFKNKEDAIATCQEEIDAYRECREDGWDDDVERVCWGIIVQKAEGFDAQGLHTSNGQHTYQTCDYKLHPALVTHPAKPVVDLTNVLKVPYKISGQSFAAYDSDDLHAALEAAQIVVKDGE